MPDAANPALPVPCPHLVPRSARSRLPLLFLVLALLVPAAGAQLVGEYYDTIQLTDLVEIREDPVIDFTSWGTAPTGTSVTPDNNYSERWTGWVRIDTPGTWTFRTNSNDGVRLWVDGQLIIDNWTLHAAVVDGGALDLGAGWYPIRLEHFQQNGGVVIQLFFQGPGQSNVIIPQTHLAPEPPGEVGQPLVFGGPDKALVVPQNDLLVDATVQLGDASLESLVWTQVDGPPVDLSGASGATLAIDDLPADGDYVFRLTATDSLGSQGWDEVFVQVVRPGQGGGVLTGRRNMWQRLTLSFDGPATDENAVPNPFRDYRLNVTFAHESGESVVVPGYYAADGNAAETGASGGKVWRCHFSPHLPGAWTYTASFRAGLDVAVLLDPQAGTPVSFDGAQGSFAIEYPEAHLEGFRQDGRIAYVGGHYLEHLGTGRPFLKHGANSPENWLSFDGFDQTPSPTHAYAPHADDFRNGFPAWDGGRGTNLMGALGYLHEKGVNSVYFLTNTVGGDGDDVWPWVTRTNRTRYDCSKLDQWEIVFEHMDDLGIALHLVHQETENDNGSLGLDGGALGLERRLYYRELVARFGHHLGVTWNLGEEISNTVSQLQEFYAYVRAVDPYDHPIVVHTAPNALNSYYGPLSSAQVLEGTSLQLASVFDTHDVTLAWRAASAAAGRPWVNQLDEIGPYLIGVKPDAFDFSHNAVRKQGIWGNLMAGGGGFEHYFGYNFPDHDLSLEDYRSRDHLWELGSYAIDFFQDHVPLDKVEPADQLVNGENWCLADPDPGRTYVVYLPNGGPAQLYLDGSTPALEVHWYNPRQGGDLQQGSVASVSGPGWVDLGSPPGTPGADWAILVKRPNQGPVLWHAQAIPDPYTSQGPLRFAVGAYDPDGEFEVREVRLHFFLPDGYYLGAVPIWEFGYGFWMYELPELSLFPGVWPVVAEAVDVYGGFDLMVFAFVSLP